MTQVSPYFLGVPHTLVPRLARAVTCSCAAVYERTEEKLTFRNIDKNRR
jgi:hypothetical protein